MTRNLEAHEARYAARAAAGRDRGRMLAADFDLLVATGRLPEPGENRRGILENLCHDPLAGTEVNMAARRAARDDGFFRADSRLGMLGDGDAR